MKIHGALFPVGAVLVLSSNEQSIEILFRAIENAGFRPDLDVLVCINVAASDFYSQ
jgi:enolase